MTGKLIAKGATADIIDIGGGKVFKRFHDGIPDAAIDSEIALTLHKASVMMGAPAIYERVSGERGRGFVMERVEGRSMLELMLGGGAFSIEENARVLAGLQVRLSCFDGEGYPDGRETLRRRILGGRLLSAELKERAVGLLDDLPDGRSVCHMDLHPGNVLMSAGSPRVIDWCDTVRGDPMLDAARTLLLFESEAPVPGVDPDFLGAARRAWALYYRDAYEQLSGKPLRGIGRWMAVIAAARFDNEAPSDRERYEERIVNGE